MKRKCFCTLYLFSLALPCLSFSESIAEKKAHWHSSENDFNEEVESFLLQINKETEEIHFFLRGLYKEVSLLYETGALEEEYLHLLEQINIHKERLFNLETTWREMVTRDNRREGYGLWHAPETTLEQLIVDYGSQDYVYLIPPEVGNIKLSIDSNLPIPRAAWSQMLELILTQNGVGIRNLNPYLRQLFLIKHNHSHLQLMTNQRQDLDILPTETRVAFVLSPEPAEVRRTFSFLEKFINPNTTTLHVLGRDILLIGQCGELQDLLRLNDFICCNRGEKEYRVLPILKMGAEEMAKVLGAIFDQTDSPASVIMPSHSPIPPGAGIKQPPPPTTSSANPWNGGLKIIPLPNVSQALFIVGTREEVRKAEEIIRNVESQIGGVRDKVVFWYTVKNSDAEELAEVLYRVYSLMMTAPMNGEEGEDGPPLPQLNPPLIPPIPQKEPPPSLYQQEGYYQEGGYIVNPAPAQPRIFSPTETNDDRNNFIVDAKTGSIVMVVEASILPKIKDLLRKLDVPKKMVQIETLLFEKILNRENSIGLNLLKIGDAACNNNVSGALFNNIFPKHSDKPVSANLGVFEFFLSRRESCCGIPAFDLVYRFLLNQDDVQINSNPSLMTVNQTPATIAINEDISINTGVFEVETAKGVTLKDAFTRAQYGITISIKPTIHAASPEDPEQESDYVSMETDITFDTIHGGHSDRPNVTRRHITNQVQVPDGDTVILGGLRRKVSNDSREAIPFLGELPGLGKLFSINTTRDSNTEMFIFITPHIVKDPKEQLHCLRQQLLCLRPGDIPYFLECVEEAHQYEKTKLMEGSMMMLFGRPRENYYILDDCSACSQESSGEYDGR